MKFFRLRIGAGLLLSWSALSFTTPTRADSGTSAAAQALFDEGKRLMAAGNYIDACPKLEESQRLDPALGTLLNLGDCFEKEGRVAAAWSRFVEASGIARVAGHPDAEKLARDRAEALAPRLSRLVIVVDGCDTAGLEVSRDDVAVGPAQWDVPIPVDSGTHEISATAPRRRPWKTSVQIEGAGSTSTVTVPLLEETPIEPPPSLPVSEVRNGAIAPPQRLGTQRTIALVAGGIGVVGVAVGTVFALQSIAKREEASPHCPASACDDERWIGVKREAITAGNRSTVGFVVGGVGFAAGAVLWLTGKPSAPVQVGFDRGSVVVRRTW